jgi:glycosyltransferase involved in cell wall biosynthesis
MTVGAGALYLCYFGLREPLVQTQVLPYLRELVDGGFRMSLLTFEPDLKRRWNEASIAEWQLRLASDGIDWHALPYHKRPSLPATLYDIARGAWRATRIARRQGVEIFHARSHVGAAIGALAKRATGARLIFDIRGFLAEGYVDAGSWPPGGYLYRMTKAAEHWLYRSADGFVVLTESAREALSPDLVTGGRPVEVIPCCIDQQRFAAAARCDRDAVRAELGLTDRLVLVYVGALGGYYLTRETAELLAAAREIDSRVCALVLTQGPPAAMVEELERLGLCRDDYRVTEAPPQDVPRYLRAADVALALIRGALSRRGMSPSKVAEYLAAGLPVIATAGIGDLDLHVEEARVGVLLRRLDRAAYGEAFRAVAELRRDPGLAERCRQQARLRYDLGTVGGPRYRRLYEAVLRRPVGA